MAVTNSLPLMQHYLLFQSINHPNFICQGWHETVTMLIHL